jgi:hypothetical protein
MKTVSQETVHAIVERAPAEGLWTSFGSWGLGEMGVLWPAKAGKGDRIPEVRDLSVLRLPDGEPGEHAVAAHTEVGALFLAMLEAGEL